MKTQDFGEHYYVLSIDDKEVLYSFASPVVLKQNGTLYCLISNFNKKTTKHIKKYCKGEEIISITKEEFQYDYSKILELVRKENGYQRNR